MKIFILTILLTSVIFVAPSRAKQSDMVGVQFADIPVNVLITEAEGLRFMREEEKMARDVYLQFFRDYGVRVFKNIASSEQTHMDSILKMMNLYNIPDSSTGVEGTFNNPDLQMLHDILVKMGSQGLVDAYLVGALIEETDIKDIVEIMEDVTSQNILRVYENLLCGSRNHMRAFVSRYEKETGNVYQVQIPEMADTVADILSSNREKCGGR